MVKYRKMSVTSVTSAAPPVFTTADLCVGNVTDNKLFQLAGSPDNPVQAYAFLNTRVGTEVSSDGEARLILTVNRDSKGGISCFQLVRSRSREGNNGLVSILVFNKDKKIIRW